jgi:hypothetical protein
MKPTTTSINPWADTYCICRVCGRLWDYQTGYMLDSVPDDSPGILHDSWCAECAPSNAVKHGLKPVAWVVGAILLAFHVALLVLVNL